MSRIAFLVAAAALFAFAPLAARLDPVLSSLALVGLGVLLAVAASGGLDAFAVAAGALGALGGGVLGASTPAVAGAVLVAAAFAERTVRVQSRTARGVHVLLALTGGALASVLSNAYADASPSVVAVAAVVGAVLAAAPLFVEAADPVSYALEQAASAVGEPARGALREGAELRRRTEDVSLDRATAARVKETWRSLLRLAEARGRFERHPSSARALALGAPSAAPDVAPVAASVESEALTTASAVSAEGPADAVVTMIDRRIVEHVVALSRAYAAVDTVSAARVGLDDTAVKTVASMGESLDEVSRAIIEVRGDVGSA